jgi:DNA-binding transcriptional regulator YiaG
MPNIAKILKEEISRVARREIRASLDRTRKSVSNHQREIASLKGQVKDLARQVSALGKALSKAEVTRPEESVSKQTRFVPKGLASTRKRLGLSAADLAKLMGVSAQTIYNWEGGATRPSAAQQAKLVSLRGIGKRQMQAHLAALDA